MGIISQLTQYAPTGQQLLAQGSALGVSKASSRRAVSAKAYLSCKAFAPVGR